MSPASRATSFESSLALAAPRTEDAALPLADRERHSLLSLVELCRTLWSAPDLHDAAESLLMCLMGQIGTTQAALWMNDEEDSGQLVLIRCHGMDRFLAHALAAATWTDLRERAHRVGRSPVPVELPEGVSQSAMVLARQARVALFAPVCADGAPIGLVALGLPPGKSAFAPLELEVVEASLGVAGMALRTAQLQGRSAENGRTLRRALDELRELDRLKSDFTDRVNHELRAPLSVVVGCLESLSAAGAAREKAYGLIDTATRSARALERLIERVLLFSASAHGELTVRLEEADLSTFIAEFAAERRPGVSAGLRQLRLDGAATPRRARFDRQRLRQVLDELVDNAVKFSLPGTLIRIGLAECYVDDIAWRKISVEDEGFGIPPERLPTLFESFARLDGADSDRAGGLGIGLPAARRVVEAMNGRLIVASEEGEGSRFAVLLPTA